MYVGLVSQPALFPSCFTRRQTLFCALFSTISSRKKKKYLLLVEKKREYRRAKTRRIFTDKYRFYSRAAASVIAPPDAAPRKPIPPLPLPCSFPAARFS